MNKDNLITEDIPTNIFLKHLSTYYSVLYRRDILMKSKVRIDQNNQLQLHIYFEQYLVGMIKTVDLNPNDILKFLEVYAKNKGYTLDHYQYIGGIHKVGYFVDEDTPYFEGIRLYYKEKCKKRIR